MLLTIPTCIRYSDPHAPVMQIFLGWVQGSESIVPTPRQGVKARRFGGLPMKTSALATIAGLLGQ